MNAPHFREYYRVDEQGPSVNGGRKEAKGLVHVEYPVHHDGSHVGVEVRLPVDVWLGCVAVLGGTLVPVEVPALQVMRRCEQGPGRGHDGGKAHPRDELRDASHECIRYAVEVRARTRQGGGKLALAPFFLLCIVAALALLCPILVAQQTVEMDLDAPQCLPFLGGDILGGVALLGNVGEEPRMGFQQTRTKDVAATRLHDCLVCLGVAT